MEMAGVTCTLRPPSDRGEACSVESGTALSPRPARTSCRLVKGLVDSMTGVGAITLSRRNTSSIMRRSMELRVGNRGYTGSPAADTYRCADGWLSTAANTPQQFRRLASVLGLDALCEDATLLDLDAFNAPEGGFVAARDASALQRLQACLAEAFAARSARDMEARLNAVGVPAARVRRLGEFLGEARAAGTVSPVSYGAGGAAVDTPGLGFRWMDAEPLPGAPAPVLGDGNLALLRELGMADEAIARLCLSGVLGAPQS